MTSSRKFVLGMVLLWGATGLIEPHTPHAGEPFNEVAFIQMVVWAVLLFGWVKSHAKLNQISPPAGAPLLAALLPPVGVPYSNRWSGRVRDKGQSPYDLRLD
jgi:hypothetical protein